jgi:telomerase reverse transcriptase
MAHTSRAVSSLGHLVADNSLGDAGFRHLFLSTSLFLPLGNNCYMQLSGPPISEMSDPGKKRAAEVREGQAKRARPNPRTTS